MCSATVILFCIASATAQEQANYTPYTIATLAGKAFSPGIADGTGADARFTSPAGMALDRAGNLYVADTGNYAIRKVTPTGVVTTLAGPTPDPIDDPEFSFPRGVVVDTEGNVIVADFGNATIRKITPAGVVTTLAGSKGVVGSRDGTGADAQFYGPSGVALDNEGNIVVADSANGMIRKVSPAGVVTTVAGQAGGLGLPVSVAVDGEDNMYVADNGTFTIRKVTSQGVITVLAGLADNGGFSDGTGAEAGFNLPYGVAVDQAGNVFVADTGNYSIRKVTPAGVVTTLAGLVHHEEWKDGTGSDARFSFPMGITVDSNGNIFVADNTTIRTGFPALNILSSASDFGFKGGRFGFSLAGPTGQSVVIESSLDSLTWSPIWTNTFAGDLSFVDPQSSTSSYRFYRAHLP